MTNNFFTIQAHEPTKDPEFVRVTFTNRDPLEIPILTWVEVGLKDGLVIDDATIGQLEAAARMAEWKAKAVRYLSFKPRTRAEVIRYLAGKGADQDAAEAVVDELSERGYLSDEEYAKLFVQNYKERASRREITWKLGQKGVSSEDLQAAIQDPEVYEGELDAALQLARKALKYGKQQDPLQVRQRLWNRLQRKGFSRQTTRTAVDRAMAEIESIAHPHFLDND